MNFFVLPLNPPPKGENECAAIKSCLKINIFRGFYTSPFGGGQRGRTLFYLT
jgi:hypothetical protein